jgi:hypothetical protein
MSDAATKSGGYQWHQQSISSVPPPAPLALPQLQPAPIGSISLDNRQLPLDGNRPPLRSHKSFPYSLGPSSRLQDDGAHSVGGAPALAEFKEVLTSQGPQPVGTSDLPPATFGGSAPTSPAGRLTPNSPGAAQNDEQMEDEEIGFGTAEQGDEEERPPMTAAELRAHKRKMKRFRYVCCCWSKAVNLD